MKELNEENQTIVDVGLVCVDFWAEWCAPCRMMSPIFENISTNYPNILFLKNNVEEFSDLAKWMNVVSIPTFILFKNGVEIFRIVGAKPEKEMNDLFEYNLSKSNVSN